MKYHQLSYRKRQRILHLNWGDLAGLHKRVATPPPNPRKKKYRTGYNKFLCYFNLKIITCVCQYILLIYFLWGKKPSPTPNINTHGSRIQGFSKLVFFVWFVWFFFFIGLLSKYFRVGLAIDTSKYGHTAEIKLPLIFFAVLLTDLKYYFTTHQKIISKFDHIFFSNFNYRSLNTFHDSPIKNKSAIATTITFFIWNVYGLEKYFIAHRWSRTRVLWLQ